MQKKVRCHVTSLEKDPGATFERFTNSSFPQKLFLFKKKMSRAFVWFGKMNKKWKIKKKKNYCVFSKKNKGK